MAERAPSRQELIRRQRSSGFVGRQGELAVFRDTLRQPPQEAAQFLFHIHGPGGVGKTTLVRRLESAARDAEAATAYVDEAAADAVEAMEAVSAQFAQQGVPLKGLDKQLATYRQRRHEAQAEASLAGAVGAGAAAGGQVGQEPGAGTAAPAPSPSSMVLSQLGLAGLGMIPGVGAFAGAVDPNQVAAGADRVTSVLRGRLRSHDDVQLVLSPLQALTPVFLQDLEEAARRRPWLVLFFDTYERTGPLLDTWLRDILVTNRYGELPANVLVVLAGQARLAARCWDDWRDLVADWPLEVFTDAEARQLLTAKGVTDERVVEVILRLSGRLPVLVSTLAEARPVRVEDIGDPTGTAVERFLKWEQDPARRAAALACALPQELDEDVYRAAVDDTAAEQFGWLRGLPFVTDHAGHCRYHDVVRSAMLRLQRRQSPERWRQQHTRLADAFGRRRSRLEEGTPPQDGWWRDEHWRAARLQETYHRLCADPRAALPGALRDLLDAYDHGTRTLRRWTQTLSRAGHDTDAPEVAEWGRRLLSALEDDAGPGIAALTALIMHAALDTGARSLAYTLRGRDHRNAERYAEALADYDRALALDPRGFRACYGRGRTHHLEGRSEEAVADYGRAIELKADDIWSHAYRGSIRHFQNRHAEALADFDRALEIHPDHAWVLTSRGLTHQAMARHEAALADYDRALAIAPASSWTLTSRGELHRLNGRYEAALADFDRAVEIKPDSTWTLVNRALTHQATARHDDALADYDRAVAADPGSVWARINRGLLHEHAQRYDLALADFDHALGINPTSVWALVNRGIVHQYTGRYDLALADFDRAVELEPEHAWALACRGELHRREARHDDALADLSRALDISPDSSWARTNRGMVRRLVHQYEAALADYDAAVALSPRSAWTLATRGELHRLMDHPERAIEDLDLAIEINPGYVWALVNRAAALRATGRTEAALGDLGTALEKDPEHAWAHYEKAVTLYAAGLAGAEEYLTRAVALLTPDPADSPADDPADGPADDPASGSVAGPASGSADGPVDGGAPPVVKRSAAERSVADRGNLFLAHSALDHRAVAERCLDEFLASTPTSGQIDELLMDLDALVAALPSAARRTLGFRRRLEEALTVVR
ncbi:hypothetical protein GCM10018793_21510 [Streptomyces sulfonofaciens]|uniref:Tetratricopeptide repeat protein n=1 Tax=Streptomyces sulfonofaciens TaxID=68272 RepID=A0A919KYG2_9ACTN|nr:tetratricopeptide repeat protein [Streptomyces sulfonofaciens]GHH76271.1 hypothetical protein GCM10018793_21510 [Streptomyces sulfonofaciens]